MTRKRKVFANAYIPHPIQLNCYRFPPSTIELTLYDSSATMLLSSSSFVVKSSILRKAQVSLLQSSTRDWHVLGIRSLQQEKSLLLYCVVVLASHFCSTSSRILGDSSHNDEEKNWTLLLLAFLFVSPPSPPPFASTVESRRWRRRTLPPPPHTDSTAWPNTESTAASISASVQCYHFQ